MPRTPYLRGVCVFSSILTLATVRRPAMSAASSSRNGAIILQGPHHSAQKSTRTGSLEPSTAVSKLLSLTAVGFIANPSAHCWADIRGAGKRSSRQVPREPVGADRHQTRPFGPQDRAGDRPLRIDARQRCVIRRQLLQIDDRNLLLALGRRAQGLVIDDQNPLVGDNEAVDLARQRAAADQPDDR